MPRVIVTTDPTRLPQDVAVLLDEQVQHGAPAQRPCGRAARGAHRLGDQRRRGRRERCLGRRRAPAQVLRWPHPSRATETSARGTAAGLDEATSAADRGALRTGRDGRAAGSGAIPAVQGHDLGTNPAPDRHRGQPGGTCAGPSVSGMSPAERRGPPAPAPAAAGARAAGDPRHALGAPRRGARRRAPPAARLRACSSATSAPAAGEIDLIAFDGRTLVFAEVKTRPRAGATADATAARGRSRGCSRASGRACAAWRPPGCATGGPARPRARASLRFDAIGVVRRPLRTG